MPKKPWTCQVCGEPMDLDVDKRGYPYLNCFGCGVQTFVRRKPAVKLFYRDYGTAEQLKAFLDRYPESAPPASPPAPTPTPQPKDKPDAPPPAPRKRKLLEFDD